MARALRRAGLGKDGRVGVLMTNRPEWLAAVFGPRWPAGSRSRSAPFPPRPNWTTCCGCPASRHCCSSADAPKDFAAVLTELEPGIGKRGRGAGLAQVSVPAAAGRGREPAPGIEAWDEFLAPGSQPPRADRGDGRHRPTQRHRGVVLLLRIHQQAQGHSQRASRGVHPVVAVPPHVRLQPGRPCAQLDRQRLVLVRQLRQALGSTLACGGTLVLQPTFDAAEALDLMEAERVNNLFAWPHQWAQLEAAPNWAGWTSAACGSWMRSPRSPTTPP